MATKGKILALISSGRGLPLKDGKVYSGAGYYLNEVTVPVRALMEAGYEITFANPTGNTPQVDVHSEVADFFGGDPAKLQTTCCSATACLGSEIQFASRMSSHRAWINMTLFSFLAAMAR